MSKNQERVGAKGSSYVDNFEDRWDAALTNPSASSASVKGMYKKAASMRGNELIHGSFPSQGTEQRSHLGSQSRAPDKENWNSNDEKASPAQAAYDANQDTQENRRGYED